MSEINTEENQMKVSIEFEAAGLAESSLDVSESGYSSAMSNSAIVGSTPEFSYPEGLAVGEVTIKFSVDDSVKENTVGDYAENCKELQGIKRFNVFKYFEDTNMLLPIETFHDEEQGIVYTKTDCLGTYCVMDLEIWMQNLGVEPEMKELTETTETVEFLSADTVDVSYLSASEDLPAINSSEFNVVFYLDTRKSVDSVEFEEMKTMIGKVSDFISTDMPYINAYTYMGQSGRLSEIPKSKYYNVISEYEQENSDSSTGGILDISKGLSELCDIFCDGKTAIFIICSKNEVKGNNKFAGNVINTLLKNHDIIISLAAQNLVVKDNAYAGTVTSLSNGKLFVGLENEPIEKFLYSLTDERGYSIITANNYETVTLATVLRENTGNKDSDTDKDGITDWDEVDVEAVYNIKGDSVRGKSYLTMHDMPTIKQCLDYYDDKYFYVQSGFGIYQGEHIKRWSKYIDETRITPIISDPTNVDSDFDLLDDGEELKFNAHPLICDSDADEIIDGEEVLIGTNPISDDTDEDGLSDGIELCWWYDPLDANPDGDSYNDYDEWANNTSPYVINLTGWEEVDAFLYGGISGDWITADNVEQLLGQVAFSFVPVVADLRDYFANVFKNRDSVMAIVNWLGAIIDISGAPGVAVDVGKTTYKLGKFVAKYADDAPKVIEAIIRSSKLFPDSEEVIPGLAKIISSDTLETLEKSIKKGYNLTRADYVKTVELFDASGEAKKILNISEKLDIKTHYDIDAVVWLEEAKKRGQLIDKGVNKHGEKLSKGLGDNFPIADRLDDGILVSTKSVDLGAKTYQNPKKLQDKLEAYAKQLNRFENLSYWKGDTLSWGTKTISKGDYNSKVLEIVLPNVTITDEIAEALKTAKKNIENVYNGNGNGYKIEVWFTVTN